MNIFLFSVLLKALFPPRCLCCRVLIDTESPLCDNCDLLWRAERDASRKRDGFRRTDGTFYLAAYTKGRSVARTLVLCAKRSNERRLYKFFADEMVELIAGHNITADYIVNVPRRPAAVRNTGVDQAQLTAKALAAATGIPYLSALRHRNFTRAQKTLDAAQRAGNAASAYKSARGAETKLADKTVILVDDVATTGSTLAACEMLLRTAGAARVIKIAAASAG